MLRAMRLWTLSLLALAAGSAPLFAQRNDATALELANLKQDVRLLQQMVGELKFQVEDLQRANRELATEASTGKAAFATLAQLNEAVTTLHRTMDAALADQKRETLQQVGAQITKLAKETDAAIASVAKQQAARPPITTTFTDDFPKEGVSYTVQAGESLTTIAKKFGVPAKNIQNANKIADPSKVKAGQQLFIPGAKTQP